jgi:hypothetical protein
VRHPKRNNRTSRTFLKRLGTEDELRGEENFHHDRGWKKLGR